MKAGMSRRHEDHAGQGAHSLTGKVGGSFGMKAAVYPEYVCILHARRRSAVR
jgi:CO/xanthine dehydrogenase Mo-binding subunit